MKPARNRSLHETDAMPERLLILGASARAAAHSARRSGFEVRAADLFADVDLQSCAETVNVADYPGDFLLVARQPPLTPWLYTGGLENHPELVDQIASIRPLWGNPGPVLRAVRDHASLQSALAEAGLNYPEWADNPPLDSEPWLRKPRRSSGGANIRFTSQPDLAAGPGEHRYLYQRFIAGAPRSAVYLASSGKASLLGVTHQELAGGTSHTDPFRYVGSWGPLKLNRSRQETYRQIGNVLARQFCLRGLFGVDTIDAGDGIWVIEVNPRYPASAEVIEQALDINLIRLHANACLGTMPDVVAPSPRIFCGKLIVFAPHDVYLDQPFQNGSRGTNQGSSRFWLADIPSGGVIQRSHPVCTVLARADSCQQVRRRLAAGRQSVLRVLVAADGNDPGLAADRS